MHSDKSVISADFFGEKFSKIIASYQVVPFGVSVFNRDLCFLHANELMAEVYMDSAGDLIGRDFQDVDPFAALAMEPSLTRAIEEGIDLLDVATEVNRSPGDKSQTSYWLVSYHPLKAKDGSVQRVVAVLNDVTQQKQKKMWDERLAFEAMLSSLSAALINISVHEVDAKIEQVLQQMVEFLGFDMITIRRVSPGGDRFVRTHWYALPGIKEPPVELNDTMTPVWNEMVRRGKTFRVSDVDELPDRYWQEKLHCRNSGGIKSILFIPASVNGAVAGLMAFVSHTVKREWPDDLIKRLRVLWEVFANALERKRADEKIHEALAEIERLKNRLGG